MEQDFEKNLATSVEKDRPERTKYSWPGLARQIRDEEKIIAELEQKLKEKKKSLLKLT